MPGILPESSSLLPTLEVSLVYLSLGIGVWVFYTRIWPKIGQRSMYRVFFEASVVVVFLALLLTCVTLFLTAPNSPLYNLLELRLSENGSHISSFALASGIVLLGYWWWKDAVKSLLYGGLMIAVHEGLWFVAYLVSNAIHFVGANYLLDLGFFFWLGAMAYTGYRVYGFRVSRAGILAYIAYLVGWSALGFPVTVTNVDVGHLGETVFYGSLQVNGIETLSWTLIFAVFALSLLLNERVERLNTPPAEAVP